MKDMTKKNLMREEVQDMLEFFSAEHLGTMNSQNKKTSDLFWVTEIENTVDSMETATIFLDRTNEHFIMHSIHCVLPV